jgi:hypothetical protein
MDERLEKKERVKKKKELKVKKKKYDVEKLILYILFPSNTMSWFLNQQFINGHSIEYTKENSLRII